MNTDHDTLAVLVRGGVGTAPWVDFGRADAAPAAVARAAGAPAFIFIACGTPLHQRLGVFDRRG